MADEYRIEKYQRTARQVAMALSWSWQPPVDGQRKSHQPLFDGDGREIVLSFDGWNNKNRISVTGNYPRYANGNAISRSVEEPSITVSMNKSPARIAADIERRFYGDFCSHWSYCAAEQERSALNVYRMQTIAQRVMDYSKATMATHCGSQLAADINGEIAYMTHPAARKIEVHSDETATIERVTVKNLEQLMAILRILES